ncbi:MAG: bifunctional RNase H/acid phosphatase [Pseudonocardiales bacterium]
MIVEADGGSRGNPGPAGYGAVVRDARTGEVLAERSLAIGRATNNVAEYQGLIAGLQAALDSGGGDVEVRLDSKLLVEQMSGRWQVKHPDMKVLARQAAALTRQFGTVRFTWVPRVRNAHADRLANEAMDAAEGGRPRGGAALPADRRADNRLTGWMDGQAPPTTTILMRHAETSLSAEKRFSGRGDNPLTEAGLAQARSLASTAALLGRVDAVVSSPLRRARQTADLVAEALGLSVTEDAGFAETDFGEWEGLTFGEVRQRWPDEVEAWLGSADVAPPGGESFAATTSRVRQARDRVLRAHPAGRVVIVSHVTPIKTLLRLALDAPPQALHRMHLDLTGISEVDWYADGPAVVKRMNDASHLGLQAASA